jgi:hypothetical protein
MLKDLYTNNFKCPANSKPRYAAGVLVYTKEGLTGFPQLAAGSFQLKSDAAIMWDYRCELLSHGASSRSPGAP